jgi:hypothetical protein
MQWIHCDNETRNPQPATRKLNLETKRSWKLRLLW